jgi:preprotein translocase subunit Sss1
MEGRYYIMEKVVEKLDCINQTLEKMLTVMQKPDSRFMRVLLIAGAIVGALGIIQVIDTILKWF